jgi:hypothetical protein
MLTMPKRKKSTTTKERQAPVKADVVVAPRPRFLDQAIAKIRAAVETVLDFADATADKLNKTLRS